MNKRPLYVLTRHCGVSNQKNRPAWFSKEVAFKNLIDTIDDETKVIVMLDSLNIKDPSEHYTAKYADKITIFSQDCGSDAHSFINLVNYVCGRNDIPDNAIIYLLEDDYVHRPGWCDAMREAFDAGFAEYVTLYDHCDKYDRKIYKGLASEMYVTKSCHWRVTPSTTNTHAMLFKTLKIFKDTYIPFSDTKSGYGFDHDKFMYLNKLGHKLISPIPGYSTHMEIEYLSPVIDWESIMRKSA